MDAKIKQLLDLVREYVKGIVDPVLERLSAVEKRQPEKGEPGKSVTMEELLAWAAPQFAEWKAAAEAGVDKAIARAAADVPKPKDGQSVNMEQVSDLLKGLFDSWAREAEPRMMAAVKSAVAEIPAPKDGAAGKDAAPVDVEGIKAQLVEYSAGVASDGRVALEKMLAAAVEAMPKPAPGKDGIDAKEVDVSALEIRLLGTLSKAVSENVAEAVAAIPAAKDGADGKDAAPADVEAIKAVFAQQYDAMAAQINKDIPAMVAQAIAAIPKPRDGDAGKSVTIDDVMPLYKTWFAEWALGAERAFYEKADRAIAAMPKPKDGRDGISAKDVEFVDGRILRFTFADGTVKEWITSMPSYRNVFKEGTDYQLNDLVTYGGSLWIAQKHEGLKSKPDAQGNDAWKLIVKKGSDGRDMR